MFRFQLGLPCVCFLTDGNNTETATCNAIRLPGLVRLSPKKGQRTILYRRRSDLRNRWRPSISCPPFIANNGLCFKGVTANSENSATGYPKAQATFISKWASPVTSWQSP